MDLIQHAQTGKPFVFNGALMNQSPRNVNKLFKVRHKASGSIMFLRSEKEFDSRVYEKINAEVDPNTPVDSDYKINKDDNQTRIKVERLKEIWKEKQEHGWPALPPKSKGEWSALKSELIGLGVMTDLELKNGNFPAL